MTVATDNPAGRLHEVLKLIQSPRPPADKTIGILFAERFNLGVEPASRMRSFEMFYSLVQDVVDNIRRIEGMNHDLYLRHVKAFRTKLAVMSHLTLYGHFAEIVSVSLMEQLEVCSDNLSRVLPQASFDQEKLRKLVAKIEKLSADVLSIDADAQFKAFLLSYLSRIRDSLNAYLIYGPEGVVRIVEEGMFPIYRMDKATTSPEGKTLLRKVIDFAQDTVTACEFKQHAFELFYAGLTMLQITDQSK